MNNKTKTKKRKTILGCQESNPSLLGERRLVNQMNNRFNIINIFYYNKDYEKKKKKKKGKTILPLPGIEPGSPG